MDLEILQTLARRSQRRSAKKMKYYGLLRLARIGPLLKTVADAAKDADVATN